MKTPCRFLAVIATLLSLAASLWSETPRNGRNKVPIRRQQQDIYYFPGSGNGPHLKVLFAPGDGGWRGFAVTIAEELAKAGYDVYGVDTRHYLQSFTGPAVLTTAEIASDFKQMAEWVRQGEQERVLFVGWSEGAGLGLAATSDAADKEVFAGLVAIGTGEQNILALRWTDIRAEVTKSLPHEPTFNSAEFVGRVSPLPLFLIASTSDEYVTPETTRSLFSAARDPKRLVMINAHDHKYSGNANEFFRALREGLVWIRQQHR
jgi:pimeloyl-ACP methyl ester carboxylesterase